MSDEPVQTEVLEVQPILGLTPTQRDALLRPLNRSRVAHRSQGSKQLSYLEAWDVKRCLIRVFGFGGFDVEVIDEALMFERAYRSSGDNAQDMIEVAYRARVRLTIKDQHGFPVAVYTEGAVGQANVSASNSTRGDAHDNALKTAASDALKRCAINLGTQFGLSLYDSGNTADVVGAVLVGDTGRKPEELSAEAKAALENSLGAKEVTGADAEHATGDEASSGVEIPQGQTA